jgi:predicted nucleotidyltransferase
MTPKETRILAEKICTFVEDQGVDLNDFGVAEAVLLAMQGLVGVDNSARIISDSAPKRSSY